MSSLECHSIIIPNVFWREKLISSYFRIFGRTASRMVRNKFLWFYAISLCCSCYRHVPMAFSLASDLFSATEMTFLTDKMLPSFPSSILPLFQSPPVGDHPQRTKPFLLPGASKSLRSCPLSTSAVSCLPRPWHLDQFVSSSPIATHFLSLQKAQLKSSCSFICWLLSLSLFPLKIEAQLWLSCLQLMSRIETGAWKVISK